ncbi:hypothetical protein HC028_24705 [Planosporangium flavigriseum]|uniref:hypothetical protein n=1 Tax=Planosporangium flavigriseum TaxID=373681 RepID=UPI001439E49D|nr:hypothetical protein [Planosporangium flavigriseum]NJC67680.1 hypothetical protein [Planosporangium flavigriseum]
MDTDRGGRKASAACRSSLLVVVGPRRSSNARLNHRRAATISGITTITTSQRASNFATMVASPSSAGCLSHTPADRRYAGLPRRSKGSCCAL